MGNRFAAERIVVENGEACEAGQKQAEPNGQRLEAREWQP
jgi:hypothetical protein